MTIGALLVGNAAGRFPDAANDSCRVGHEPVEAGTLGTLVNHLALSIGTAGAFPGARIFAAIADTGKGSWAVRVDLATDDAHVVEADVAQEAVVVQPAGEHAHLLLAPLVVGAVVVVPAAQHADAIVATHSRRTSGVVDARVGDPDALNLRIAGERRRAGAELGVVGGLALGVDAASVSLVARVPAASAEAHLVGGTLVVGRAGGFKWSNASELVANVVARAVLVGGAELLLAANLLIIRVAEKALRADADGPVFVSLADGIPAADDRPLADVPALTLAEEGVLGGAGLLLGAVVTASALFSQNTDFSAALVEAGALVVLAALGDTLLVHADLVAQTVTD